MCLLLLLGNTLIPPRDYITFLFMAWMQETKHVSWINRILLCCAEAVVNDPSMPGERENPRPARASRNSRCTRAQARAEAGRIMCEQRQRLRIPVPLMVRRVLEVLAWSALPAYRTVVREVKAEFSIRFDERGLEPLPRPRSSTRPASQHSPHPRTYLVPVQDPNKIVFNDTDDSLPDMSE